MSFFPGPVPPPAGPARRIVSLVPSQTELLADLGLDAEVLGLTTFCVRPPGWREAKTRVGGTKQVKLERVRALQPDLVLANQEENTRADVEALARLAPVYVTDVPDLPAALEMIRAVGDLVGRPQPAAALAAEIQAGFAALDPGLPLRTAYLIWRRPWMTVGRGTFIHDLLARAGFQNAFGERERYPEVTPAELTAADPALVLLSSEPFPFKPEHADEVRQVLPRAKVAFADGELCSWYGSRLRHAPAYLARLRAQVDGA